MPDDAKTQVVTRLLDGTASIPATQPPTCHCGTAMTRTPGGWVCEREISRDGDRIQVCGASIESPHNYTPGPPQSTSTAKVNYVDAGKGEAMAHGLPPLADDEALDLNKWLWRDEIALWKAQPKTLPESDVCVPGEWNIRLILCRIANQRKEHEADRAAMARELARLREALEAYHDIFPELWTSESEEIWQTDAPERFCDDRGNDIEDDWINVGAMAKAALAPPAPPSDLPDCPGCTDPDSEGTHTMGTKQHP